MSILPTITHECSTFLTESCGMPLILNLPSVGEGFRKIKIRHKKSKKNMSSMKSTFDLSKELGLEVDTVFLARPSKVGSSIDSEFYVFIPNGYAYMYNVTIKDSDEERDRLIELVHVLGEKLDLAMHYNNRGLASALKSKCEIVFSNIAYYYAIRVDLIEEYQELITQEKNI